MADTFMAVAVHTVVGDTSPMDSFFKKICRSPLLLSYPTILPISDILTHIEDAFKTLLASGLLFWFHHASLSRFSKITRNPSPLKNLFIG